MRVVSGEECAGEDGFCWWSGRVRVVSGGKCAGEDGFCWWSVRVVIGGECAGEDGEDHCEEVETGKTLEEW